MNKEKIYKTIVKHFIMMVKEYNCYYQLKKLLRRVVNADDELSFGSCNSFGKAWHLNWLCEDLNKRMGDVYPLLKRDGSVYEYIVIAINELLKHYVEATSVLSHEKIPQMGERIFNKTCEELFGKRAEKVTRELEKICTPHRMDLRKVVNELVHRYGVNINVIAKNCLVNDKVDIHKFEKELIDTYNYYTSIPTTQMTTC